MQNKPTISAVELAIPMATSLAEIGTGGFKVVYRGTVNGIDEAVKVVYVPVDLADPTVEDCNRRRLLREIDLIGRCTSRYLVKLGQIPPTRCNLNGLEYVYYSEELVDGASLRGAISQHRQFTQRELASLGLCLLDAIEHLAKLDVIHRDIKPDNIVETGDPQRPFVLLDLGVAFIVGGTNLTADTYVMPGTRSYLAPEMLEIGFRATIDYRADLYAAGLTLYECACGHNPFARVPEPAHTTLYRIKFDNPAPLHLLRADLDVGLCGLIDQLIKKFPALRPASFPQLKQRMEGWA